MAEGNIRVTVRRGCQEPPESLARGTLSKGFSRNLGQPRSLLTAIVAEEVVGGRGQPEIADDGLGGLLRSHSTDEGGEPQGHASGGGHGTHWREGVNKRTYRMQET